MPYKILVVEDEPDINGLLVKILKEADYHTIQAFSGTEAKLLLERESPDLILLDLCFLECRGKNYSMIFVKISIIMFPFWLFRQKTR